jgi:hypothetical protein
VIWQGVHGIRCVTFDNATEDWTTKGMVVVGIDLSRSMLTCASQLYGDFAAVNVSHTQLNSPRIDWRKDT